MPDQTADLPMFVLGTSSKYRANILKEHGIHPIGYVSPDIDERGLEGRPTTPADLPVFIANAKMDALIKTGTSRFGDNILVTCDQVVGFDGAIREKPSGEKQARDFLKSYDLEHPVVTYTAIVVYNPQLKRRVKGLDIAEQYLRPIDEATIDKLIAKGDVLHTSGAFMVDEPMIEPFLDRRKGDIDSIVGMPVALFTKLLIDASKPKPAQ